MATLARLAAAGLPVPPGFAVTTECGEWADPEAEPAVDRAYHALGDGRGGLPIVCVIPSRPVEDEVLSGDAGLDCHSASTLDELLSAIDLCRSSPRPAEERPYYPGPPATFRAVGVLQFDAAAPREAVAIRRHADHDAYEIEPLWCTTASPLDETVRLDARELCRRVSDLLGSDAAVEWALVAGAPMVIRARCLTSGEASCRVGGAVLRAPAQLP
jgi:hypothetical protein